MNERRTKFCSNCGAEIDINAELCPKCGVRIALAPSTARKNSGLAAVLSFFIPGLGQIYNGQVGRGITVMLIGFVLFIFSFLIITLLITIPLLFVLWVWSIWDAYSAAEKINLGGKI